MEDNPSNDTPIMQTNLKTPLLSKARKLFFVHCLQVTADTIIKILKYIVEQQQQVFILFSLVFFF